MYVYMYRERERDYTYTSAYKCLHTFTHMFRHDFYVLKARAARPAEEARPAEDAGLEAIHTYVYIYIYIYIYTYICV